MRGQRWIHLLDYIDYRKADAVEILQRELGWEPYPAKHGESVYTRFFQNYILPRKFGYDKRRGHLASLVCAGELSRHDALDQLAKPIAPESDMEQDREFVAKKLGLSLTEFDEIMALPRKTMFDYPNYETVWWHRVMRWVYRFPARSNRCGTDEGWSRRHHDGEHDDQRAASSTPGRRARLGRRRGRGDRRQGRQR